MEVEADRKLAYVVTIESLMPVTGKDFISIATFSNVAWKCFCKKNLYTVGSKAIYYENDTVIDRSNPQFDFMKKKVVRMETIGGVVSNGMITPLEFILHRNPETNLDSFEDGMDVTSLMGLKKYVDEEEKDVYMQSTCPQSSKPFPAFIQKTDESRLHGMKDWRDLLYSLNMTATITFSEDNLKQHNSCNSNGDITNFVYVTVKEDGQSATFWLRGEDFGVAGRNKQWLNDASPESFNYWHIARKYCLENILRANAKNYAIQGEIVGQAFMNGPGKGSAVGGNKMRLDNLYFDVFNIWDIDNECFLRWHDVKQFCMSNGLRYVHEIPLPENFSFSVESFEEISNATRYSDDSTHYAEGIVVKIEKVNDVDRTYTTKSFKVISDNYSSYFKKEVTIKKASRKSKNA